MKKNIKNLQLHVLFIIISILMILAGCQNSNYKTYSSESFSFDYPNSYTIEESSGKPSIVTVKSENSRLEVFKISDFISSPGGERIHGYSSSGEEEFEWQFVPKEKLKSGDYGIWLFYKANNTQAKEELKKIFESIKLTNG